MKKLWIFMHTIRFRILMITALCWLLPTIILGSYLGGLFFASLREQTESALVSAAVYAQATALAELDRVIKLAKSVTYDGQLTEAAASYLADGVKYQDFFRYCRIYMDRKFFREKVFTFATFYLIEEPDQHIATTSSNEEVAFFQKNVQPLALALGETLDTKCRFIHAEGRTYLVRNLLNKKLERFGMLVIGIRPELMLQPLLEGSELWIGNMDILLDDYTLLVNGQPFDPLEMEPGLTERQNEIVYSGYTATRDYTLAYRAHVDKHVVYGKIYQFNRLMIVMLLLLLPIEAAIMVFVQRRVTNPLRRLVVATNKMEAGELGVTVQVNSTDEVGQLSRGYNRMSLQIRNLIERSFEEELILRDARIEALQSRINPHFLNNTLEMINWQARMEGSETISGMIEAMSTLVNASLDRTNTRVVPLEQELQVADAYFYFLDQRFGKKLQVEREIDTALLHVPVPRLVIQTLLENAVEHGIAPAGGGLIRLNAYAKEGLLHIDVTNNGKKLTDEDRARIGELLREEGNDISGKLSERLGIRNINRRAKLIYGENAGLSLMRDESGDTLARLVLPTGINV